MVHKLSRLKYLGLSLFVLIIIFIYSYRLGFPFDPYYDEVHYVRFLQALTHQHTYDYVSTHPPVWHLLTWPSFVVLQEQPVSWRLISWLAGLMLLFVIYLLTRKILKTTGAAILAVFYCVCDGVSLTQARIGMMNSLTLLFMLLAFLIFLQYGWDKLWPRGKTLCLTGIFLGLALATKWAALGMFLLIYFLLLVHFIQSKKERLPLFLEWILFLVILPLGLYFLSFTYLLFLPGYSWHNIWEINVFNFHFHTVQAATHTHDYMSQWWGWPLLLRPIWFYFTVREEIVRGIICIGNPAIFWLIPFLILYCIREGIFFRNRISGLITIGFLSQWLFYALGGRLKFFHYIYFAMPFVYLGLAWVCQRLWQKGWVGKTIVCSYVITVLAMFIFWYPLLTGMGVSQRFYEQHLWFRSWM